MTINDMPRFELRATGEILPRSQYELVVDDLPAGIIQIRHKPSHGVGIPESMSSHIYYEIDPQYRNRGYGKQILALGLGKAKEIGLKEVMITCLEDNLASQKIIESNGGIFIEEAFIPDLNKKMFKYKITLS
jgi:predicted acetyltransferase